MLRCIVQLYDGCKKLLDEASAEDDGEDLSWAGLKASLGGVIHKVSRSQYLVRVAVFFFFFFFFPWWCCVSTVGVGTGSSIIRGRDESVL